MRLHLAAALRVLFQGLPPAPELVRVTEYLPLGDRIDVYATESRPQFKQRRYFRSCKEAFEADPNTHVSKEPAIALPDDRFVLARSLCIHRFEPPLEPDAQLEERTQKSFTHS